MKQKQNSSNIHKDIIGGGGVASVVLSCCAPELRASPTNFEATELRGSNVWSEKELGVGSVQQRRKFPILCHTEGHREKGRPPKPFASNPLIDRNDSLVDDGSLVSLVASDCETARSFDEDVIVPTTPIARPKPQRKSKPFESSPLVRRDDSLVQQGSLLSLIASQDETLNNYHEKEMVPSTPQISYAKYNSHILQTPSRDTSFESNQPPMSSPPSPALELSVAKQQASQMMGKLNMRRELSRGSLFQKVNSVTSSGSAINGVKDLSFYSQPLDEKSTAGSISASTVPMYNSFRSPPPIWIEEDSIHSELKRTYKYPRLFASDSVNVVGGNKTAWWYRLSDQMDTTLRHVFDPHWREAELQQQNEWSDNVIITNNDPCNPNKTVDLFSDNTHTRLLQTHEQSNSSSRRLSEISPINAWSEPAASTMKVRGKSYAKDGIKCESDTALFACLGVDSFVNDEGGCKDCSNTMHYLDRWNIMCRHAGLNKIPFLLIINFIVPWGNFQSYSFRPDAENGPFSSKAQGRPSEKAWRAFLEGDTDYRNAHLKLIPRVCAGPWVVKKMVGTTPALIGTKLPVTYGGSIEDNYLEITMDVTKGPAFGNTVATTAVSKADLVTVDLGFVIEGEEDNSTLPEQMLSLIRLHHLEMKKATTIGLWRKKVEKQLSL